MQVNSSGKFVAVGDGGYVSYSNDGITWDNSFSKVGTVLGLGGSSQLCWYLLLLGLMVVSYSDDGITWATPFPGKVGTAMDGIAVNSAGRFVAVGDNGYITMSLLQDTIQISSNGGTTWGSDIPIPIRWSYFNNRLWHRYFIWSY